MDVTSCADPSGECGTQNYSIAVVGIQASKQQALATPSLAGISLETRNFYSMACIILCIHISMTVGTYVLACIVILCVVSL